jgi:predicted O-methyltransferase YrrM
MTEEIVHSFPDTYREILQETESAGFTMASDVLTCSLLRTLAAAKPSATFLELGTGTGLSTSWILDGMDKNSALVSIDNDANFLDIATKYLGSDNRARFECTDGADWVNSNKDTKFDYIFADTWHGKYLLLDEVLLMLNPGGFYIIDDMIPQPNWPEGHQEKALNLISYLDARQDLLLTKQVWATGIIVAVKKASR